MPAVARQPGLAGPRLSISLIEIVTVLSHTSFRRFTIREESVMTTLMYHFAWFDLAILGVIAALVMASLYGDGKAR